MIPYHLTPSGGSTSEEGISQWTLSDRVTPGIYSLDDYDFRKPNAWLFQARQNPVSPTPGQIDVYDWPGRYTEHQQGSSTPACARKPGRPSINRSEAPPPPWASPRQYLHAV